LLRELSVLLDAPFAPLHVKKDHHLVVLTCNHKSLCYLIRMTWTTIQLIGWVRIMKEVLIMMKIGKLSSIILCLMMVAMVFTVTVPVNVSAQPIGVESQITTDASDQYRPAIYGDKIVWQDHRNGNVDIYIHDLSTNTESQINSDLANQVFPAIYGDRIVWRDNRNGDWNLDIFMYDLSTSTESQITTNVEKQDFPAIYGDKIVWGDKRNGNWDIYLYDLSIDSDGDGVPNFLDDDRPDPDPAEEQITTDTSTQWYPSIYGNRIVWDDFRNGNKDTGNTDIYMYDLDTKIESEITTNTANQIYPVINGDRIVWEDYRNGDNDIYMYDLNTNTEVRITSDYYSQSMPDIFGDRIVWADYKNGYPDIYMYDLTTSTEWQITTDTSSQKRPAIYGDWIVWDDNRNGNIDIYINNLNPIPPDLTPPVVTPPPDMIVEATSAEGAIVTYPEIIATDNVEVTIGPTCNPPSGSLFPFGETTVEITAEDAAGNIGSATFLVTVQDTTAPIISVEFESPIEATDSYGAFVTYFVTASDLVDPFPSIDVNPGPGSMFPLGETEVICSAMDNYGNEATTSFTVTVQDTSAPELGFLPDITVEANIIGGANVDFDLINGEYEFDNVPVGEYIIRFTDPKGNYLTQFYNNNENLQSVDHVYVLPDESAGYMDGNLYTAHGYIQGSVNDNNNNPLQNIQVDILDINGEVRETLLTLLNGEYQSKGLSEGEYIVRFSDPTGNYLTQFYSSTDNLNSAVTIFVDPGVTTGSISGNLQLAHSSIQGYVNDDNNNPLQNIQVDILDIYGEVRDSISTSFNGEYQSIGLPEGEYIVRFSDSTSYYLTQFYHSSDNLNSASTVIIIPGDMHHDINGNLYSHGQGGSISGLIRDTSLNNLQDILVEFFTPNAVLVATTTTLSDGTYNSGELPVGNYRIRFSDPSDYYIPRFYGTFIDYFPNALSVNVYSASTVVGINALLAHTFSPPIPVGAGSIVGTVSSSQLVSLPAIQVDFITPNAGLIATTITLADGTYNSGDLPAGDYRIRFSDPSGDYQPSFYGSNEDNFASATIITLLEDQNLVDINMILYQPIGSITGNVYYNEYSSENSIPDILVQFFNSNADLISTTTTLSDGSYNSGNLPSGDYRIRFSDPLGNYLTEFYSGGSSLKDAQSFILDREQIVQNIDILLSSSFGTITGEVVNEYDNNGIQDILVEFFASNAELIATTTTLADGTYDSGNIPAGEYRIRFSDPLGDYLSEFYNNANSLDNAEPIILYPGWRVDYKDAQLTSSFGTILGWVGTEETLVGLPDILVEFFASNADLITTTTTLTDGSYESGNLPADEYRIRFSDPSETYKSEFYSDASSLSDAYPNILYPSDQVTRNVNLQLASGEPGTNGFGSIQGIVHEDGYSHGDDGTGIGGIRVDLIDAFSGAMVASTHTIMAADAVDDYISIEYDPYSHFFPLGQTTVTATMEDNSGNIGSDSFIVTVIDTTAPTLNVPSDFVMEATSPNGAEVSFVITATDIVDEFPIISSFPASGSTFPFGDTTVVCTATDLSGNSITESFTIIVEDTTAPALNILADIIVEATSEAGAVVTYIVTASDLVDESLVVSITPASGTTFPRGITTVLCSVTDSTGNTASASFTVTVQDTTSPVLNIPADIAVEATSEYGAIVTFTVTATDIVDPSPVISCSPVSGSTFPLGSTTVSCSATDSDGNTALASFTVTVQDTTLPVLTIPADILVEATSSAGAVVTYTVTAYDLIDPNPVVSSTPASGTTFSLGLTTVLCTATDSSGNTASASFTITVQDTTAPTLNAPADIVVEATSGSGAVITYSVTATDLVDPSPIISSSPSSGSTFPLGDTTVLCSATDSYGNIDSASFTISVQDTTPPTLNTPADIVVEATSGAGAFVTYSLTATDLVNPSPIISSSPASGTIFSMGVTTVSCSAMDSSGNTASASFTVTVQDTTAPALSIPANIIVEATSSAGASVSYSVTASDFVDPSPVVSSSPPSGTTFALGVTTVSCSATDSIGNTISGTFTITVQDTTPPTLNVGFSSPVEATSASGAEVIYTASAIDLVDPSPAISCSPASGTTFPLGVTTVFCSATDSSGNTATASFTITIQDTTAPTLSIPSDIIAEATSGAGAVVIFTTIATDSVDPSPVVSTSPASGTLFPLGVNTVICSATDSHGNVAIRSFTVYVLISHIEVAPSSVEFGDVEIGLSQYMIATISNTGDFDLTVSDVSLSSGSTGEFSITSVPLIPYVIAPGDTVDVELSFTPSETSSYSDALQIISSDPERGLVEIPLNGVGVVIEVPPGEQIALILIFFDESEADGTLSGNGPGGSAQGRMGALRNMIEATGDLIEMGSIVEACEQLQDILKRTDGNPRPPDFVTGVAALELTAQIQTLIDSLSCP
jgi:beta propeller repeat protein